MNEPLPLLIWHSIFGYSYYLPIYVRRGTFDTVTSATPYRTRDEALAAARGLASYDLIEIIHFHSHEVYAHGQLM